MRQISIRPSAVALLILFTLALVAWAIQISALRMEDRRIAEALAVRESLSYEIADLKRDIEFAQSDAYVERVARDQLGLIYPEEIRYVSN